MKTPTEKENETLLLIFKDLGTDYNANSISKKLNITPRGALKILNNLYSERILIRKKFGKALFYKLNFEDNYARKLIETLLIKESKEKASRWLSEFEGLFGIVQIVLIYGSIVRTYEKAKDIDLLLVIEKSKYKEASKFIDEKNNILLKPVHPLIMTLSDLEKNLKNKNPAMMNAIREGYVLNGQDKLIKMLRKQSSLAPLKW